MYYSIKFDLHLNLHLMLLTYCTSRAEKIPVNAIDAKEYQGNLSKVRLEQLIYNKLISL